jgi:hypothetical protein
MPLYFFHFRDREGLHLDPTGSELADVSHAREEAIASFIDLLANDSPSNLSAVRAISFEVTDEGGMVVLVLNIAEALLASDR